MADTKISNFTAGTTVNSTDRIAAARSPFGSGDNRYLTIDYFGTYFAKNTLAAGTLTTSQPMTLTQTWNAGAVTFRGAEIVITDTASASGSTALRVQGGAAGTTVLFSAGSDGTVTIGDAGLNFVSGGASYKFTWISGAGPTFYEAGNAVLTIFAGVSLGSGGQIGWCSSAAPGNTPDLKLVRDAANTLAQRNGVNAQTLRVYQTFTDASNYERFNITWDGSGTALSYTAAGTGISGRAVRVLSNTAVLSIGSTIGGGAGGIILGTDAANYWGTSSSGHWFTGTDNTYDIGASGANRPRTGYFGTSLVGPILKFGLTSSDAAVKGNGTFVECRLGDDSGYAPLRSTNIDSSGATIIAASSTAIPAGGTAGVGYRFSSTSNFGVFFGSGAPSLSAAKGSLYLRSDGSGINDRAYINTNGTTTWTAIVTVA